MKNSITTFFKTLVCLLITVNAYSIPYTVSSSGETWDNTTTLPSYDEGIIIPTNSFLIINGLTLNFKSTGFIEVNEGAELILNNAELNSLNPLSNDIWLGITGKGVTTEGHFDIYPDPESIGDPAKWAGVINPNQTHIGVNNSIIKNAKVGIYSHSGAIVRFRNIRL